MWTNVVRSRSLGYRHVLSPAPSILSSQRNTNGLIRRMRVLMGYGHDKRDWTPKAKPKTFHRNKLRRIKLSGLLVTLSIKFINPKSWNWHSTLLIFFMAQWHCLQHGTKMPCTCRQILYSRIALIWNPLCYYWLDTSFSRTSRISCICMLQICIISAKLHVCIFLFQDYTRILVPWQGFVYQWLLFLYVTCATKQTTSSSPPPPSLAYDSIFSILMFMVWVKSAVCHKSTRRICVWGLELRDPLFPTTLTSKRNCPVSRSWTLGWEIKLATRWTHLWHYYTARYEVSNRRHF